MTTFKVSPDELRAFAGRMYNTSSGLYSVSETGYGEPNSGWPGLDHAVSGFASHWGSTLTLMAQDLSELADKVTKAADAYSDTETSIVNASAQK